MVVKDGASLSRDRSRSRSRSRGESTKRILKPPCRFAEQQPKREDALKKHSADDGNATSSEDG